MAIPKSQIETWSSQGAITTSKNTYNSVKTALQEIETALPHLKLDSYLQGSYGNDTNVYSESDVDVVCELQRWNDSFLAYTNLNDAQRTALEIGTINFDYNVYKREIVHGLKDYFGEKFVKEDNKAVKILPNGNRRACDVIVSVPYNFYLIPLAKVNKKEGIKFFTLAGAEIINFPKLHSERATEIHQDSNTNFKGVVRVVKNIRNRMVDDIGFNKKSAPSYFIENWIGNVSTTEFTTDLHESFINVAKYLMQNNWDNFYCLNNIRLLFGNTNEQWNNPQAQNFLNELVKFHDNWK